MSDFALAVTVHDPDERIYINSKFFRAISKLYKVKVASITKRTSPKTAKLLKDFSFIVVFSPSDNEIGSSRKNAVKTAQENSNLKWIHYCDLDRLLHWVKSYPQELKKIISKTPVNPYTAIGRTKKAWQTHPKVMVDAEKTENNAINNFFNLNVADFTAGSCLISRQAAQLILKLSVEPTNATDLEWPAIIKKYMRVTPACILTKGMEFETPDYYKEEIKNSGSLETWIKFVYENPNQIEARQKLAQDSIDALNRTLVI